MTSFIRTLAGSVISILVAHVALGAEAPQFSLRTGDLAARLSPADGRLLSLAVRGHELLAAPAQLFVQVNKQEAVPLSSQWTSLSIQRQGAGLRIEGREPRSGIELRAVWTAGPNLECRTTLVQRGPERLEAAVELSLPCVPRRLVRLAPSGQAATVVDFTRRLGTGYRGDVDGMVMPATIFYQPEEDWGLTVFADFALPTRGFEVWTDVKPARITVRRVHLRLDPGRPVEVSLILFGHAGDWRPGLGHVVQRYPEFFRVADPRIPALDGPFVCSGGTPTDQTLDQWQTQHVQTVEVHGTLPFYGQHLPLGDSWPAFADDQWHGLKQLPDPTKPREDASWKAIYDYVCRKSPERISAAQINNYIRRLHAHGMFALMYFNPTESWKPWIMENYPEALAKGPTGDCYPTWYESWIICPEPESRWGRHLLNEFQRMMELYPEADGFFMDQSCYDHLDYAHDDGWTIQNGRTAYRLGWAIGRLNQECRKLAKARGKFVWWNGPYCTDIAYFAEGMMAEAGNEDQVRAIHWLTAGGRACCTLSQQGEGVFQNCAAYGLYPTAMPGGPLGRLADRYRPLLALGRGKQWIFHPRALELAPGTKGNIYRLSDGNVLAVMVTDGRSVDGSVVDLDVPLVVRLPDAAVVRAAYFLSPDLEGLRRLGFHRDGEKLQIAVPRHRSVSAVLLATGGAHYALEGPMAVAVDGKTDAHLVIDNWTAKPLVGRWRLAGKPEEPLHVAPGQSVRRPVILLGGDAKTHARTCLNAPVVLDGRPLEGRFESYTIDPLDVSLDLPQTTTGQDQPVSGRLRIFNATKAREAAIELVGEGLRIEPERPVVQIGSQAAISREFRLLPLRPGTHVLRASVQAGGDRSRCDQKIEVEATRATPAMLREIRAGRLVFDVFGSDGGKYENKPVSLNGVVIGLLPRQGDSWATVEMPLPPAALATIRTANKIRIENRVGDAFKVRNFRLRLQAQVGLISKTNPETYTSCAWEYAEGRVFSLGQPLTGIDIRIPMEDAD
jgi:hypothetical protein